MVQLTRIVTKGGDKGKTSLGDGSRVSKNHTRIAAIGDVDELNALIGLVRTEDTSSYDELLQKIQNDLFDLGADLCVPDLTDPALRITSAQLQHLDDRIEVLNATLTPLTSFILPGGSRLSAYLHMARTVARRAERSVIALHEIFPVNPLVIQYLNRLSDLFFILARAANQQGQSDVLWIPGGQQS